MSVASEASATAVESGSAAQLANAWQAALHSLSRTSIGLLSLRSVALAYIPYLAAIGIATVIIYRRKRSMRAPAA